MNEASKPGRVTRRASIEAAKIVWHHADMAKATDEQLAGIRRAVARLRAAEAELEGARTDLAEEIAAAIRAGVRPVDIEPEVPYKREHIRRLVRAQGVPPLRPPTATSIRSTLTSTDE